MALWPPLTPTISRKEQPWLSNMLIIRAYQAKKEGKVPKGKYLVDHLSSRKTEDSSLLVSSTMTVKERYKERTLECDL